MMKLDPASSSPNLASHTEVNLTEWFEIKVPLQPGWVFLRSFVGLVLLLSFAPARTWAQTQTPTSITQVPITNHALSYSQSFDSLASSGTSSSLPSGFAFLETGKNNTYTAGPGNASTADTYSFGTTGSNERAFGTLRDSTTFNSMIGVSFINNTGATINQFTVSYTGEQWRLGAAGAADRLDFQYRVGANSLVSGSSAFTDVDTLDFVAPVTSGDIGALDGNATANRTRVSMTITGFNLDVGSTIVFRWVDFDAVTVQDGLAIDDLDVSFGPTVPEPATCWAGGMAGVAGVAGWMRRRGAVG